MKLAKMSNKVEELLEQFDNIIGELEEKRDAIEDKACERDRDMTEREQERYDALDQQIEDIRMAMDCLEEAISNIEEYC